MTSLTNILSKSFGTGDVYALVSGLTPVRIGILQDVEIDIAASVAELYGQNTYPEAIGRGKSKITGKAKIGQFDANMFASIYVGNGVAISANYEKEVKNEAWSNGPGSSAYLYTPVISSAAIQDLGLYYSATGVQLSLSTAGGIGNYSIGSSVGAQYVTSSLEPNATAFLANYNYQATTGNQVIVANSLMGTAPTFSLHLYEGYTGPTGRTNFDIKLNACIATKMSFPNKNSDFMVSDFEFSCFADSNEGVYTLGVGT